MFEKKRKIKKLGEPVWKTKSLYWSRIWIRIVPLDAMMGSRSSNTLHQMFPAALHWSLLEQILAPNTFNSINKALLKPRVWLPKRNLPVPEPLWLTSGVPEPTRERRHLHCPPVEMRGPGLARLGHTGWTARMKEQKSCARGWLVGNMASPHPYSKAGRSLPAATEPLTWVMETGPQREENQRTNYDTNCKDTEGQWMAGPVEGGTSFSLTAGGCCDLFSGKATKCATILTHVLPQTFNRAGRCSSVTNWEWETHWPSSCSTF